MSDRKIHLAVVGESGPDNELLYWLSEAMKQRLHLDFMGPESIPMPSDAFDPDRCQASSNLLIDALIALHPAVRDAPPAEWILGITATDIFAPARTFVFGEAALGGAWALVSTARLAGDLPGNQNLLRERLLKEALHEVGHVAGLPHCHTGCVMAPSSTLDDIDAKSADFCSSCRSLLGPLDPFPVDS